ncbi:alpha/beta fold hydrolase [Nocardia cyriacigeorgica]|uniref:alpha/beta fold hydrolase n=1 Tax=Nocardia cyriacigeorgica TaxID=135487 RepID=UPI00189411AB|nr:alpha/beta fold hydrolase [Nocardia cyriacigeorgica]MBF6435001.1 alpha/beta fold hydrolase [Nocardia cyriacigeorgica]MBF6454919.1 alpha/beta fold hydrolase [Nocardia cyriacigeorgica]MBF6480886.1 alpha/beta fold hydrolase [Nocardia cyriacigeorgica]MBF6552814.1 alpha/beta fold hydrolase [Nocardia cyriacigeorgica]
MTEPRDPARHPQDGPAPDRRWRITVDGVELAGFEWGDPAAQPLVLVHGASDTHRVWEQVAVILADEFRVITYDVRGHGRSGAPHELAAYRLDRLAEDLYAVIDTASPHQPVHLAGHGWGAVQGWEAVLDPRANTRIASFTALSAPHLDHLGLWLHQLRRRTRRTAHRVQSRAVRRFAAVPPLERRTAAGIDGAAPPRDTAPAPDSRARRPRRRAPMASALDEALLTLHSSPSMLRRALYQPRVHAGLRQLTHRSAHTVAPIAPTWRADLLAGARIVRANLGHHLRHPRDQHTAVPVQLLLDAADPAARPGVRAAVQERVDRLWCYTLPADHWLPVTEPLLVGEAIANFVSDLRADSDPVFRTTH